MVNLPWNHIENRHMSDYNVDICLESNHNILVDETYSTQLDELPWQPHEHVGQGTTVSL